MVQVWDAFMKEGLLRKTFWVKCEAFRMNAARVWQGSLLFVLSPEHRLSGGGDESGFGGGEAKSGVDGWKNKCLREGRSRPPVISRFHLQNSLRQ